MNHMWLIILVVLALLAFGGGYGNRYYSSGYGIGIGGFLLVILLFLFLTGRI